MKALQRAQRALLTRNVTDLLVASAEHERLIAALEGVVNRMNQVQQQISDRLASAETRLTTAENRIAKVQGETTGLLTLVGDLQQSIQERAAGDAVLVEQADRVSAAAQRVQDAITGVDDLVPDQPADEAAAGTGSGASSGAGAVQPPQTDPNASATQIE